MDNAYNQSAVAYEDGPKEVNAKRGLNNGDKQFGKADKMEQDEKSMRDNGVMYKKPAKYMRDGRYKECR